MHGHPEPDTQLRDSENVPLGEDVAAYFEREIRPHVPDAWIAGIEIAADIRTVEAEILSMVGDVTG